jgi:hypothetical protein
MPCLLPRGRVARFASGTAVISPVVIALTRESNRRDLSHVEDQSAARVSDAKVTAEL